MYNYDGPERRRHHRQRAHFITNYRITQPPEVIMNIGQDSFEAVMLDLSEGGMAIVTRHNIPEKTTMSLEWTLINPHAVEDDRIRKFEVIGEVRDCDQLEEDEFRLGITFVGIGDGDQKAIAEFIRANRRDKESGT